MIKKITLYRIARILLMISLVPFFVSVTGYKLNGQVDSDPAGVDSGMNAVWAGYLTILIAVIAFILVIIAFIMAFNKPSEEQDLNISLFIMGLVGTVAVISMLMLRWHVGNIFGPFLGDGPFATEADGGTPSHGMGEAYASLIALYILPIGAIIYQGSTIKKVKNLSVGTTSKVAAKATDDTTIAVAADKRVHERVWDYLTAIFVMRTFVPFVLVTIYLIAFQFYNDELSKLINDSEYEFDAILMFLYFVMLISAVLQILSLLSAPYLAFRLYVANKDKKPLSDITIILFQVVAWYGVITSIVLYSTSFNEDATSSGLETFIIWLGYIISIAFFIGQLVILKKMNKLERNVTINDVPAESDAKVIRMSGGIE